MTNDAEQPGGALAGYASERDQRPLMSYGALVAAFGGSFAALLGSAQIKRRLPERIGLADLLLLGTATHKLSRLLAKDKVTSVLRAPFTEYQEPGGPAELEEKPRGTGMRYAVGELLVCPYCLGQWVASGFAFGLVLAPRQTRFVGGVMTMLTISDFLQIAYKASEERGL